MCRGCHGLKTDATISSPEHLIQEHRQYSFVCFFRLLCVCVYIDVVEFSTVCFRLSNPGSTSESIRVYLYSERETRDPADRKVQKIQHTKRLNLLSECHVYILLKTLAQRYVHVAQAEPDLAF